MIKNLALGRERLATASLALFIGVALSSPAQAAGSSMPWEAPLQSILESIQGPVAKIMAVIIIIALILTGNAPMLRLMKHLGFSVAAFPEDPDFRIATKAL